MLTPVHHLDPTPERPERPLDQPAPVLVTTIDVAAAHLANPGVALSRLLASEASAFARVNGDEERIVVEVALPDADPTTAERAAAWVRWAAHNAGIRGAFDASVSQGTRDQPALGNVPTIPLDR